MASLTGPPVWSTTTSTVQVSPPELLPVARDSQRRPGASIKGFKLFPFGLLRLHFPQKQVRLLLPSPAPLRSSTSKRNNWRPCPSSEKSTSIGTRTDRWQWSYKWPGTPWWLGVQTMSLRFFLSRIAKAGSRLPSSSSRTRNTNYRICPSR